MDAGLWGFHSHLSFSDTAGRKLELGEFTGPTSAASNHRATATAANRRCREPAVAGVGAQQAQGFHVLAFWSGSLVFKPTCHLAPIAETRCAYEKGSGQHEGFTMDGRMVGGEAKILRPQWTTGGRLRSLTVAGTGRTGWPLMARP